MYLGYNKIITKAKDDIMTEKQGTFSERLKSTRKLRGLTQQKLADAVGIKRSAYAYYELGKCEPSLDVLKKISDVLGVSSDFLISSEATLGEESNFYNTKVKPGSKKKKLLERLDSLDEEQTGEVLRDDYRRAMGEFFTEIAKEINLAL